MKVTSLLVCSALVLSGCGALGGLSSGASSPFSGAGGLRGSKSEVEGIRFRTRLQAPRDDRRSFTTTTRGAGRGLAAAAEAGRVEAVEYCIRQFGGSEILWIQGPDREPEELPLDESGSLVLAGTCITR